MANNKKGKFILNGLEYYKEGNTHYREDIYGNREHIGKHAYEIARITFGRIEKGKYNE